MPASERRFALFKSFAFVSFYALALEKDFVGTLFRFFLVPIPQIPQTRPEDLPKVRSAVEDDAKVGGWE